MRTDEVPFQLTQRADFFEEEVGLETTLKRPIINTRDEPHADAQKYRRLHVIAGDANLSEVATFLKLGTTAMRAGHGRGRRRRRPARRSPARCRPCTRCPGTSRSAQPLAHGRRHLDDRARDPVGAAGRARRLGGAPGSRAPWAATRWATWSSTAGRRCSTDSRTDPMALADQLDWVAKYRLFDAYRERHDLEWTDARLRGHGPAVPRPAPGSVPGRPGRPGAPVDRRRRWSQRCPSRPTDTRAYFRGTLPGALRGRHRRRQLGLASCSTSVDSSLQRVPDAGAGPGHRGRRRRPHRRRRPRRRTCSSGSGAELPDRAIGRAPPSSVGAPRYGDRSTRRFRNART